MWMNSLHSSNGNPIRFHIGRTYNRNYPSNLSETAKQLCHLSLATTTQIISNELWLLLSYIAKNVKICEVQDFKGNSQNNFNK